MFNRNELYRIYKFSIIIFDILEPYWNLYTRIKGVEVVESLKFPSQYNTYKENCDEIYNSYLQKIKDIKESDNIEEINNSIINQVLHVLTEYVSEVIYQEGSFYEHLKKNVITIINDRNSMLFITKDCDEEKLKLLLKKSLKKSNPILLLLKTVDATDEIILKNMINNGLYDIAAENTVQNVEIRSMYAPIYNISDFEIDLSRYGTYEFSQSDYWINHELLSDFQVSNDVENKLIGFSDNSENSILAMHGLIWNKCLIPLISDFKERYSYKTSALWTEFKFGVYHHKDKNEVTYKLNTAQQDFLNMAKDEFVTNKLSYLEENLYIPQEHVDKVREIQSFFNDVTIIDELSELDNYQFFAPDEIDHDTPFFGIHKKDKAGSKSYKLLHYICKRGKKMENTRGISKTDPCKNSKVKILKPELSFYYLLRYYEDFFALALKELQNEGNLKIEFVTNQKVLMDGGKNEIDVIVFNGTNIYMIELKTNLSIEYIVSFQKKCNKWINSDSKVFKEMNFIIAGSFGKETLNICGGNRDVDNEYNVPRENMNGYAHSFSVPLDYNKELICFTESSFERLKKKLLKILN